MGLKLGVIGYGSIASQALKSLAQAPAHPLEMVCLLAKPAGGPRAQALLDRLGPALAERRLVVTDIGAFMDLRPDLVAEAAGHHSLRQYGPTILSAGCDLVISSVGALADEDLSATIDAAAQAGGARRLICPGAVGGLELIAAAKLAGLTSLTYTSRKPPSAWRGTAAEESVVLEGLREPTQFFEGTARQAARLYPQNANVAATVALHGGGFEQTLVRMVADPGVTRNTHVIALRSACVDMEITIAGLPSPDNPKTSMTAGFALGAQIMAVFDEMATRKS